MRTSAVRLINLWAICAVAFAWCFRAFPAAAAQETAQEKIVNGEPVTVDWPWMVSIGVAGMNPSRTHFCGGVVVDQRFVLTAAHCVLDYLAAPDGLQLFIGKARLTDAGATIAQSDGIILHPAYDPQTLQNDIALIRLVNPLPAESAIPIVSAAEDQQVSPGQGGLMLGWGTTDSSFQLRPSVLQQALIPFVDSAQCQDRLGLDFDPASMLCAGVLSSAPGKNDGVDACFGDSGGPLMLQTGSGWKLAGLASWGLACVSDRYWGVYTRASSFIDWIKESRTIAPYTIDNAAITGTPQVGQKLSCYPGLHGGDPAKKIAFEFRDGETADPIARARSYVVKKGDVGRTMVCNVTVSNAGGELNLQSAKVGPMFPARFTKNLTAPRSSGIRRVGVSCKNGKCRALVVFKEPMASVRSLLTPSSKCRSTRCRSEKWHSAERQTSTAWAVNLPASRGEYRTIVLRASVMTRKKSFVGEIELN